MSDYTSRAIKQIRHASENITRANDTEAWGSGSTPEAKLSTLLTVLSNSIESRATPNRAQVEGAVKFYFDALERSNK